MGLVAQAGFGWSGWVWLVRLGLVGHVLLYRIGRHEDGGYFTNIRDRHQEFDWFVNTGLSE